MSTTRYALYATGRETRGHETEQTTAQATTTPTRNVPTSWQLQSDSASTQGSSQTPPFPVDETPANWPNGFDASPMEGRYSPPRTMGPGISPMPSNYLPPSTSLMTPPPTAFPDRSSTPLPALRRPSTPSARLLMPPLTGGSTLSSSATESSTRRPRLSTIASATSRQRFREYWLTSGLPLDVLREPEPRLTWDTSDSEPEALRRPGELDGDVQANNG